MSSRVVFGLWAVLAWTCLSVGCESKARADDARPGPSRTAPPVSGAGGGSREGQRGSGAQLEIHCWYKIYNNAGVQIGEAYASEDEAHRVLEHWYVDPKAWRSDPATPAVPSPVPVSPPAFKLVKDCTRYESLALFFADQANTAFKTSTVTYTAPSQFRGPVRATTTALPVVAGTPRTVTVEGCNLYDGTESHTYAYFRCDTTGAGFVTGGTSTWGGFATLVRNATPCKIYSVTNRQVVQFKVPATYTCSGANQRASLELHQQFAKGAQAHYDNVLMVPLTP